jgi:hypothetical protein
MNRWEGVETERADSVQLDREAESARVRAELQQVLVATTTTPEEEAQYLFAGGCSAARPPAAARRFHSLTFSRALSRR